METSKLKTVTEKNQYGITEFTFFHDTSDQVIDNNLLEITREYRGIGGHEKQEICFRKREVRALYEFISENYDF